MSDNQYCPMCKKQKMKSDFNEGRTQCKICLEYKRRYRENHKEELRQKSKEHYEQNREKILEKLTEKVECPICKIEIRRNKMKSHEQTKRHIHNLNNPNNPKQTLKQQQDKEKEEQEHIHRIQHQQVIEYLNNNFPSYPEE